RGSVIVSATTFAAQDGAHWLSIKVSDTGPGMSKGFIERMFDPYSQERNSSGGTGLGMSISKQLVELMGGRIEVASVPGVGTTFDIILPFGVGTESDLIPRPGELEARRSLQGLRILLVEDNDMNRLVATTILERQGVQVIEAYDGVQSLERLRHERYDVVLMDVHMPVMDGLTATRAIRSDLRSDIPIIALTANALKGDMEKCLGAGMNAVLTKPFQEAELLNLIARFVPPDRSGTAPLVDLTKLKEIARGDQAFVQRMIDLFIDQAPRTMEEMQQALEAGDPARIGELAHRLKSSLDSLGVRSLHEVVRSIEVAGRTQSDVGPLIGPVEHLRLEVIRVLDELKRGAV
ncbi:MAG: response regulator, partial [Flavobacteriales bacterium]